MSPDHPIRRDGGAPGPLVTGDEAALRQVVGNLLANVRVHTPAGTTATVSVGVEAGHAVLVVADDGPGVDPDLAEDAFLPGRMLQPRGRFPGVGMGLPFARLVVSRHGGSLHLEPVGAGAGTAAVAVVPSAEGAPPPPSAVAGDDR